MESKNRMWRTVLSSLLIFPSLENQIHTILERFSQFSNGCNKRQIQGHTKGGGKHCYFSQVQMGSNPCFLLLQAALFLGLGVLFSLVSIPLVIYDWACSSNSDEGH